MFILFSKFTVINDKQWAACSRLRAPRSQKLLIGHALISNGWKFSFLKQENLAGKISHVFTCAGQHSQIAIVFRLCVCYVALAVSFIARLTCASDSCADGETSRCVIRYQVPLLNLSTML